jgi:hypothetical protein
MQAWEDPWQHETAPSVDGGRETAEASVYCVRKELFFVSSPALLSDMGITAAFSPCGILPLDLMFGFSPFSRFCRLNMKFVPINIKVV